VATDDLRVLGRGAAAYEPDYPRPGWAEQAPELWEAALAPAIGRALASPASSTDASPSVRMAGRSAPA
jgi:xylulokinase